LKDSKFVVLPRLVPLLLVVMTIGMLVYTVSAAIVSYSLIKPYVVGVAIQDSRLTIESTQFVYDPPTNRYGTCSVAVRNTHTESLSGTVYVYLVDSNGTNIASGQATLTVGAGITNTASVSLTWNAGKTVVDMAGGRTVVVQG